MTREQRIKLNKELYNYKQYKQEAKESLCDAFYGGLTLDYSNVRTSGGGGGNGVESRVIRALSDSEKKTRWLWVFEYTLIKYTGEHKDLVMKKKFIEHKDRRRICKECAISQRTYFYWLDELLNTAFMWAEFFKLF